MLKLKLKLYAMRHKQITGYRIHSANFKYDRIILEG